MRFEWRNASRLLQTHPRLIWIAKRMEKRAVLERVYRMDEYAEFDWSLVCDRVLAPGQGAAPTKAKVDKATHDLEGMRVEYLLAVLKPLQWYCANVPKADVDDEGRPVELVVTKYFQVVAMTHGKSRPAIMPTIESHKDVALSSLLALNVQDASKVPGPS